jgi:glyoxylase-like metal-dependent hydrolase (beta-lactamase superfamily II)
MKHLFALTLSLCAVSLSAATSAQAQTHDQTKSDVVITPVKDNLYMFVSPHGGNVTASTGFDGTFIIDDQLTGRSALVEGAIKTISDQPIKFVLNTHYHFDHTGGNEFFGEKDAIIMAHDNVRKRLSTDQFITHFGREMPALSKTGLPVLTFAENMTLHYNDDTIQIIHAPNAHTDGDAVAHFTNDNVIVAGDLVFNGMYPFIDTEHGGSIKGMIAAHDVLLNLANAETIIIPGHGGLMSKADLQAYQENLTVIATRVEEAKSQGKSLKQVLKAKLTADFDAEMGNGVVGSDAFVTILYEGLQ